MKMEDIIFDENDELDSIMLCSDEIEFDRMVKESYDPVSALEDYKEEKSIDCMDVPLDDTEVSPIGSEAEVYIDADQELLLGDDEDNELIDLVGGF